VVWGGGATKRRESSTVGHVSPGGVASQGAVLRPFTQVLEIEAQVVLGGGHSNEGRSVRDDDDDDDDGGRTVSVSLSRLMLLNRNKSEHTNSLYSVIWPLEKPHEGNKEKGREMSCEDSQLLLLLGGRTTLTHTGVQKAWPPTTESWNRRYEKPGRVSPPPSSAPLAGLSSGSLLGSCMLKCWIETETGSLLLLTSDTC